jgi:hypothetical protein
MDAVHKGIDGKQQKTFSRTAGDQAVIPDRADNIAAFTGHHPPDAPDEFELAGIGECFWSGHPSSLFYPSSKGNPLRRPSFCMQKLGNPPSPGWDFHLVRIKKEYTILFLFNRKNNSSVHSFFVAPTLGARYISFHANHIQKKAERILGAAS